MDFFNTRSLSQDQRFHRITIIGVIAAILLGFAYGFVSALAGGWELHVLYLLIGLIIARLVRQVGRGAQKRFRILAALLVVIVIITGDILYPVIIHQVPVSIMISYILRSYLSGISGLLSLLFRLSAIYVGYNQSI